MAPSDLAPERGPKTSVLPQLQKEDYTVAWICALPETEMLASRYLLDELHDSPLLHQTRQQFCFGAMCRHNIVMTCLPVERIGQNEAAAVLSALLQTFPSIRFALMVGIAGGIWSRSHDVRLGDVVVSCPSKDNRHGGVVQYDYGKAIQDTDELQPMGIPDAPSKELLTAMSSVRSTPPGQGSFETYLSDFNEYRTPAASPFARPSTPDHLYTSDYVHCRGELTCAKCDEGAIVDRQPRDGPKVHYGLIASGNAVVKDAISRDRIACRYQDALAIDMEAAAVVSQCSCLVIRGISDYCDSHKNKSWQPYASAAAAAWAKELLRNVSRPQCTAKIEEQALIPTSSADWQLVKSSSSGSQVDRLLGNMSSYEPMKILDRTERRRLDGTAEWIVDHDGFVNWQINGGLLWLVGKVGSGKTIVMERAIRHLLSTSGSSSLIVHYFASHPPPTAATVLRSFAKQIVHTRFSETPCPSPIAREMGKIFGKPSSMPDASDVLHFINQLLDGTFDLTLCLDGYDQCRECEQQELIDSLHTIMRQNPRSRVLVSSGVTADVLWSSAVVHVETSVTSNDINSLISQRLSRLSLPGRVLEDHQLCGEVNRELAAKADGMYVQLSQMRSSLTADRFLWVDLVLKLIETCDTEAQVRSTISNLPSRLEEVYIRCLTRTRHGRYVCNPTLLRWVMVVAETLTLDQVQDMFAIDATGRLVRADRPTAESILRGASGLLAFDHHDRSLMPIHHSVQKYLFSDSLAIAITKAGLSREDAFSQLMQPHQEAVTQVAQLSLAHILSTTGTKLDHPQRRAASIPLGFPAHLRRLKSLGWKQPSVWTIPSAIVQRGVINEQSFFYSYALRTWPLHTRQISTKAAIWNLFATLTLDHRRPSSVFPWRPLFAPSANNHRRAILDYAITMSHSPMLELVILDDSLPQQVFTNQLFLVQQLPALHAAASKGHTRGVELLLRRCDPASQCPKDRQTALHHAAKRGHLEVVMILLKANPVIAGARDKLKRSALLLAAEHGHMKVAKALVSSKGLYKTSHITKVIQQVVAAGRDEAFATELLQEWNFDFNLDSTFGTIPMSNVWTTLMWAAHWNFSRFIQALLIMSHPSSHYVNIAVPEAGTALAVGIRHDATEAVRSLLAYPLVKLASQENHLSTVLDHKNSDILFTLLRQPSFSLSQQLRTLPSHCLKEENWSWLVEQSESINRCLRTFKTTLSHEAVRGGCRELIQELRRSQLFDKDSRDAEGITAADRLADSVAVDIRLITTGLVRVR